MYCEIEQVVHDFIVLLVIFRMWNETSSSWFNCVEKRLFLECEIEMEQVVHDLIV